MAASYPIKVFTFAGQTGGNLATVPVSAAGSNFTSVPTVAVTAGTFAAMAAGTGTGKQAAVIAVLTPAAVNATFTQVTGGQGYKFAPKVRLVSVDGNGTGATATANLTAGVVSSLTIGVAGSGYTQPPIVVIEGGEPDRPAAFTAILVATTVASLSIVDPGIGYATVPTITISGGGGSGATCTTPTIVASGTALNKCLVEYWGGDTWRFIIEGRTLKYTGEEADLNALLKKILVGTNGLAATDKLFGTTV